MFGWLRERRARRFARKAPQAAGASVMTKEVDTCSTESPAAGYQARTAG